MAEIVVTDEARAVAVEAGDGGLRDALATLADELDSGNAVMVAGRALRGLIAAHPAVQVDREALTLLLHDENCDCEILKPLGDYRPEQFLEQRRRHAEYYGKQAEAVLALLSPEETK